MEEKTLQDTKVHVAVLHERLDHLDDCVDSLKEDLMGGNGKPGELPIIKSRLDTIEKMMYKALGAVAIIVILSNFFSGSGWFSFLAYLKPKTP